jgi:hypothetical protein
MGIWPGVSAASLAIVPRRSLSQAASQCAMRLKRGHQNAFASG